jgi:putative N6-adenine-specific DNA methylase
VTWGDLFDENHSFAVFASVNKSQITHSQYAALRTKDAIADYFRSSKGKRPSVDPKHPDVWINLHIERNQATISLDTSGGSLHRRGYRKATVETSMQETVAAAMIKFSEWNSERPLYDPMCGSGTLICEALMCFCRIPSGLLRQRFGFEFLPDFNRDLWAAIKQREDKRVQPFRSGILAGSDISKNAVKSARKNIQNLPHGQEVELRVCDFKEIPDLSDNIIICNPPYGLRTGSKEFAGNLYKELGDYLKKRCQGSEAFVYFGDRSLIPKIGLRPAWKKPLRNGGLDGRLAKFEIY